ncbi:sensor histidine kinase [Paenibacillus radicis (ex Xue et al. 2023)]|uniref:ATP-binding protein n=1 Tax=Paenibacillus radicis (ex Xue et al. 2023) TaxID=2972489 RepID=A0ABT1YBA2_9BACL|nr:ATP-binding protein [Paenibacillus radicis (ex Xue et al. 2023)]MCR8630473.1 ATP-binding protein [Paenibacillus radicis (ex Xue et al. 2023)]
MNLLYKSIKSNLEHTVDGESVVEELLGKNLRTVAIAAKQKLDPDYNKIDNNELKALAGDLGVDEITLFAKVNDDIIGVRSSDPKEINVSSKGWDTIYIAFNQLFKLQDVNVGMGQTLPHYWSYPIDTATTSPNEVNKWGYYYDGTTNYIINPFLHKKSFREYQEITRIEDAIQVLMKENGPTILEVCVLNSNTFLDRKLPGDNPTPSSWFSEREVFFGTYQLRDSREKQHAALSMVTNEMVFYTTEINGKSVMKSFAPIPTDYLKYNPSGSAPLIAITSDYTEINRVLNKQLMNTVWFMGLCTLLAIVIVSSILWIFRRNKKLALQNVQEAYVGNIEMLFQSVREQRHDFINHIQTIHAFLTLKRYDDLQKYTNSLVGEIRIINDLININDPALIALMQAKLTQAESLHILCEYEFKHMDQLKLSPIKATDVVKILSNLIDNAFDATMELEKKYRHVKVKGDIVNNQLHFTISNTGPDIPEKLHTRIFESGFSSKVSGKNCGLGLHIVKQLIIRYKGSIQVKSNEGVTEFVVAISLS